MTGPDFDIPVFVINLDGSDDRLNTISQDLNGQNVAFTRIAAYDGRGVPPGDIPEYNAARTRRYFGRDMTGGEIGCYISHVRAAQAFLNSGAPYGLVLEDDVRPAPDAMECLRALVAWQSARGSVDWAVSQLGNHGVKLTTPVDQIDTGHVARAVLRAHYFPMGAMALLWTRDGAQGFVDTAFPIVCPVDLHLRRWLLRGDRGLAIQPHVFFHVGEVSDIDQSPVSGKRADRAKTLLYGWRKARRSHGTRLRAVFNRFLYQRGAGR